MGTGVWNFKKGDAVWAGAELFRNGAHAEYIAVNQVRWALGLALAVNPNPVLVKTPAHPRTEAEESHHGRGGIDPLRRSDQLARAGRHCRALLFNDQTRFHQRRQRYAGPRPPHTAHRCHSPWWVVEGGIGAFSIQLLKSWNHHVIASCGASNVDKLARLGCDQVIDYQSTEFQQFMDTPESVDVILDTVGGAKNEARGLRIVKPGGHYLSLRGPWFIFGSVARKGRLTCTLPSTSSQVHWPR